MLQRKEIENKIENYRGNFNFGNHHHKNVQEIEKDEKDAWNKMAAVKGKKVECDRWKSRLSNLLHILPMSIT